MRSSSHLRSGIFVSSLSLFALFAGCGAPSSGGSSSICAEAAAHVADCEGGSPSAVGSCDNTQAAAADTVASSSCAELAAGAGKTDGPGDAICIALVIPLFATHIPPGALCCFGYQCDGAANTCIAHRCSPRRAAGEKCDDDNNACLSGLTCLPSKKCGAPLPEGATCAEKSDCEAPLTCSAGHKCAEALTDGEACTRDDLCQHQCIAGSCATASSEGGPCDAASDCEGRGLACVSKTCIRSGLASECTNDKDCLGAAGRLVCQFGQCAAQPKTGERCDRSSTFACAGFDDACIDSVCGPKHSSGQSCVTLFDCTDSLCVNGSCK